MATMCINTREARNEWRKMKTKDYPNWACEECGKKHGRGRKSVSTWHYGKCDVCEKNKNVTEVRDFGHFKKWYK
jgi:ribosomal protein L37AE/L43A